jgi:hypothetical protein
MRDWIHGTKEVCLVLKTQDCTMLTLRHRAAQGDIVSMGVLSDGSYGVEKDIVFSFPVTCKDGQWKIVQGESHPLLQLLNCVVRRHPPGRRGQGCAQEDRGLSFGHGMRSFADVTRRSQAELLTEKALCFPAKA